MKQVFEVSDTAHQHHYHDEVSAENGASLVFSAFFLAYKRFVSSQDASSCMFHPSCSVYAIQAVKSKGIVTGALATADRLVRCNTLGKGNYPVHQETGMHYDPVE